jgi:hypothetical protein
VNESDCANCRKTRGKWVGWSRILGAEDQGLCLSCWIDEDHTIALERTTSAENSPRLAEKLANYRRDAKIEA